MALRVLLADESSTIKKVFQLALQDFGVEVRSVNIGLDVATVATSFKPDIIFADVLLQKKNGYDVCAELKGDIALKSIPVVLMWSGFMELDEDKFEASQANQQLEKPFDVTTLRKIITELVPRTQKQKLSQFLSFPKTQTEAAKEADEPGEEPITAEAEEDFQQVSIPKMKGTDKYKLDLKPEDYEVPLEPSGDTQVREDISLTNLSGTVVLDDEAEELSTDDVVQMPVAQAHSPGENRTGPPSVTPSANALSSEQLEEIVRRQSQEVIESVVWKVVPELAKQIIERELNRLLK
jgi:CheY-like chemotaxis protein